MAALFIVVTLAAIGAYLLVVSNAQLAAASQDEQAARAYQAARTGIDWAAYQVLVASTACPAPQDVPQPGNFVAQVTCTASPFETEGSTQVTAYKVISTGCNAASCGPANTGATYVERRLELTLSRCTAGC